MDKTFSIQEFPHDAGAVGRWCKLLFGESIETTVDVAGVTIHPRPRELTPAELEQLESVLRAAKPFKLGVDKTHIVTGGEDYATVTVTSVGDSIVLLVRDQEVEVELVDGVGTLEVSATVPTVEPITVRAKDQLVYGFAQIEVKAI